MLFYAEGSEPKQAQAGYSDGNNSKIPDHCCHHAVCSIRGKIFLFQKVGVFENRYSIFSSAFPEVKEISKKTNVKKVPDKKYITTFDRPKKLSLTPNAD